MTIASDRIRACGSCTVCCTVIGVSELAKDAYEACVHICEAGCGIYADRPGSCRSFECQWLKGVLEVDGSVDLELRPDACGVVFDYQPGTPLGDVYRAWEVEPGASGRGRAREVVESLQENFLVVINTPGPAARRPPAR